jgi:Rrf2 family nitric oxide-sensitive transcriptional repressor
MQLNKQTDYALRILIYLAMMEGNHLVTVDEISRKLNVARNHLTKIVSKLSKLRYIYTFRGTRGGMKIHPRAYEHDIARIIEEFEPTFTVVECNILDCKMTGLCEFRNILDKASNQFIKTLRQYTLDDLLPKDKSTNQILFERFSKG